MKISLTTESSKAGFAPNHHTLCARRSYTTEAKLMAAIEKHGLLEFRYLVTQVDGKWTAVFLSAPKNQGDLMQAVQAGFCCIN